MPKFLNNTNLKIIAMICMVLDHTPYIIWSDAVNENWLSGNYLSDSMHFIGRIAFPVFAFCISEGYRHTHDIKSYLKRLGILAIVSLIPFILVFREIGLDTIFTLLFGLCALYFSDRVDTKWKKGLIIFGFVVLSIFSLADYGDSGAVIGIYLFAKVKKQHLRIVAGVLGLFCLDILNFLIFIPKFSFMDNLQEFLVLFFAIVPFILIANCYNGEKGANIGKLFYVFYPTHLIILAIIHYVITYVF